MSNAVKLNLLGQSIWYDNVKRSLIEDGTMKGMIERREIYGMTSNPSIFHEAITKTKDYDADLQTMSWAGLNPRDMFYRLAIQDIKNVADLFRPYYDAFKGADGFVSLEVNPNLAHDTQGTIDEAKWLWAEVNRPNLMVKIPATKAGLLAISESIAAGLNVNVTLIFSRKRYVEVMTAYLDGLEKRLAEGKEISNIASVASFFVSRLETNADNRLQRIIDAGGENAEKAKALKGKMAVNNTRLAYQDYEKFFASERFRKLADSGAQKQRPLWASTSTKDPDYSEIMYVEELVAENTVNTVPPQTLVAYLDHGDPAITIYDDLDRAEEDFEQLAGLGISIDEITQELEDEGVRKFADSFNALIEAIAVHQKKFLAGLDQLADAVASEVQTFKTGDVISRMHRNDPTIWTETTEGKEEIQKRLSWLVLPSESRALIPSLSKFAEECKADGFEKVLLMGMGGSSLAPETISLILGEDVEGLSLRILDSTIPEQVRAAEAWIDYKKTLFIVASKSGTTTEPLSLFQYFWAKSEQALGDQRPLHFIAITDPGSSLAEMGATLGFRAVFTANPNVGGRYSALTHFGLVPAALIGINLEKFLEPAQEAEIKCSQSREIELNPGALLGIILGIAETKAKDKFTILADESLTPLVAWLEQLVAESSGKKGRGIVPIADEPIIEVRSYSSDRIFVYLRKSGDLDSFVDNLRDAGQLVIVLDTPEANGLAEHFYRWEFAIAVACSIIGVNAFDQPDVQDSKERTKKKIATFLETGRLDDPDVIWEKDGIRVHGTTFAGLADCHSVSEVVEAFTALSKEGDYVAINAYLPRNKKIQEILNNLRENILIRTGRATTLGFGPRFLHSTGQLHKGGANNGLFLQITQDDEEDLAIPGKEYSFGILARAQAQGDLEALMARDRRAIRIHLKATDSLDILG